MKTFPLYLNGEFVVTENGFPVTNPATGQPLARMSSIEPARLAQAIGDAHAAFAGWRGLTAKARCEYLLKIADELERRREEIARTLTLENGKPLAQSAGEVAMTVDHARWFAGEGRRAYGRVIPHQTAGKRNLVIKNAHWRGRRHQSLEFPAGSFGAQNRPGFGGGLSGHSQAGKRHAAVQRRLRGGLPCGSIA
jgi:succinate-semialdehyde dehydrogenase/glutarate-semialdehyde dehydrogenase